MHAGESVKEILWYWLPELISTAILVAIPLVVDAYLVAHLKSTTMFGALGMANNFLHTMIKMAEAIPVAATAVIGRHNGAKEYKRCGHDLGDAFWTTALLGFFFFIMLYVYASFVFEWLGVPAGMVAVGVPFLRLRSFGILLMFIFFSFIGFMKGVKNTKVPMMINLVGVSVFLFFDYALIMGKLGFPRLELLGSAVATLVQYTIMNILAVGYILYNTEYQKYFSRAFFLMFSFDGAWRLINLSWPIMIDKTVLSFAYVWLAKLIAPMGKYMIASYDAIKNIERFAFLPALAFAQIITFLVSNRLGAEDFEGARSNIKRVVFLSAGMIVVCILPLCIAPRFFISFFDHRGKFIDLAAPILAIVSTLVLFDMVQVVLAGALRGAGDVTTVMWGRFGVIFGIFIPGTYIISCLPLEDPMVRVSLLYGFFYIANGIMGIIFLRRIMGIAWQQQRLD